MMHTILRGSGILTKRHRNLQTSYGMPDNRIEDFDLLIGATAVTNDLTLVTNNVKHMNRINGIRLEDWTAV